MLKTFFSFVARLYTLLVSMALAVIMGFAVWACWGIYLEEKSVALFLKEGGQLRVKVDRVSTLPHSWRDYLSNTAYLTFRYKQKEYQARFVLDSLYLAAGDSVSLLYHSQLNSFRQIIHPSAFHPSQSNSRLIKWSVINTFNAESKWLVICLTLSAFFFLYTCGVLVRLTGWAFLQTIGCFVGSILLVGASLFFSYDCLQYYQYYQHIKTNGRETKVTINNTDRLSYSSRQSRYWKWYIYTAKVDFEGQVRIVPLQESDYEVLKPGDELLVLYDEVSKEIIPVNYSLDYRQFLLAIFFWFMSLLVLYHQFIGSKNKIKLHKVLK